MKIRVLLFCVGVTAVVQGTCSPPQLLDKIEAIVYPGQKPDLGGKKEDTIETPTIITMSDVKRRHFDGGTYTVAALVDEVIASQQAQYFKMGMSNDDLERQLQKLGMPSEHLELIAKGWHFPSTEAFRQVLKELYTVQGALANFVNSELVISDAAIQAYDQAHPLYQEPSYTIQTAFSPVKDVDSVACAWDAAVTVTESEIAPENAFIKTMKVGATYKKQEEEGCTLFKLLAKKGKSRVPWQERRREIINQLKQERYAGTLERVKEEMRKKTYVAYPQQKFTPPPSSKQQC